MAIKFGTVASNVINGTAGFDLLVGDDGNDTINCGNGNDIAFAGAGNDRFTLGTGRVSIDGGAGNDHVDFAAGPWSLTLPSIGNSSILYNLTTGQRVTVANVESVKLGATVISLRTGTEGANVLTGGAGTDVIKGAAGNDRINTKVGDDLISSGPGSDTVSAGDGNDIIDDRFSTAGPVSQPPRSRNKFDCGSGNDSVLLGFNYDQEFGTSAETFTIDGGAGTDIVYLSSFFLDFVQIRNGDIYLGGTGAENLFADLKGVEQVIDATHNDFYTFRGGTLVEGRAQLAARPGKPAITGSALSEDLNGNAADNVMTGNGGYDRFFGKGGVDTAVLTGHPTDLAPQGSLAFLLVENGATGFVLRDFNALEAPSVFIGTDVERVRFARGPGSNDDINYRFKTVAGNAIAGSQSAQNDFSVYDGGLSASTRLNMLDGDDLVFGRGKLKSIAGGDGDDTLDWDVEGESIVMTGGAGSDKLVLFRISGGDPTFATIDGGAGNDTLTSTGQFIRAQILGGNGDDLISVSTQATIDGGAGNDRLTMTSFASFAIGSNQTVDGGSGDDVASFEDSILNIAFTELAGGVIELRSASNRSTGLFRNVEAFVFSNTAIGIADLRNAKIQNGDGDDETIAGAAKMDFLRGEGGDDRLAGKLGNDVLAGVDGDDTISGDAGNDFMSGGDGDDVLTGAAGIDFIDGGEDNDRLSGGAGGDRFAFNHRFRDFGLDTISDFVAGANSDDLLVFTFGDPDYDTFREVMAAAKQVGKNTVITLSRDAGEGEVIDSKITLVNVLKGGILSEDIIFV